MSFDAILIPGGGVREGGVLPEWVAARFDRALEIPGDALLIAQSAGTPHRPPPLDPRGFPYTEARAGAEYLLRRGVDPKRIAIEEMSLETIGNAYFSRVIHQIPRNFDRILVISSSFHMPRVEKVYRWVFGLPGPGPECQLTFEAVPDRGIDPEALIQRQAKEAASLHAFEKLPERIRSLAELHTWIFTENIAYAVGRPRPEIAIDIRTY